MLFFHIDSLQMMHSIKIMNFLYGNQLIIAKVLVSKY